MNTNMKMEHFFQSKLFKGIVIGIAVFIVLLVDFRAGVIMGYRRAVFSEQWGKNYERNFIGPSRPDMMSFSGRGLMNTHGVSGVVIKVASSSIFVHGEGADKTEKIVSVNEDTVIRRFQETLKIDDIKTGDRILVIGSPNEFGQIEAKLIRVVPPPPALLRVVPVKQ